MTNKERVKIAGILWERLKTAFNEEAKTYDPEAYESRLGSVGPVEAREVCRQDWWRSLGGGKLINSSFENRQMIVPGQSNDGFDDYWEITHLIESEHQGEKLETGRITFGS